MGVLFAVVELAANKVRRALICFESLSHRDLVKIGGRSKPNFKFVLGKLAFAGLPHLSTLIFNSAKSKHPSGIRPRGVSTYYLMKLSSFLQGWGQVLSPSPAHHQAADKVIDTGAGGFVQIKIQFFDFFSACYGRDKLVK